MRGLPLVALIVVASACAGGARREPASANPARGSPPTTSPAPYAQQYDPSGWSGTTERPSAVGGGPPASTLDDELRSTPDAPAYTSPRPTGVSPTKLETEGTTTPSPAIPRPGKKPLPPDVGPPPPSADVETTTPP